MKLVVYRYEDSNGYGPFYNRLKSKYQWQDDGWRSACKSLKSLKEWWKNNKDIDLNNYHIVKYTVNIKRLYEDYIINFKLDDVIERKIIYGRV